MIFKSWLLTSVSLQTSRGIISGTGEVIITNDSRVSISVDIGQLISPISGHFNIAGDESTGLKLEATDCLVINHSSVVSTKLEIKPLRCRLFNPSVLGQAWDEQVFTLKNAKFYNSSNFSITNHQCSLGILPHINVQSILPGELTAQLIIRCTSN